MFVSGFDINYDLICGISLGFYFILRVYLICRDGFAKPKDY